MLTLLHEVHFLTQKDEVVIKDSDFGAFKFFDKKQLPHGILFEGKKSYMLKRGLIFSLSNKRPQKLKDALMELEELLCHNRVVLCDWRNSSLIQIIIGTGLRINIKLNTDSAAIKEILFDKYLLGKLSSQYLCDVAVTENKAVCTYTDNQVSMIHFSKPLLSYEFEKKWSSADPKIQIVELCGPPGRRVDRRVSFNTDCSLMLIWWKCSNVEVYPWSPSVRDEERANVQVYSYKLSKLELRSYFKTEYDPLFVSFSDFNEDIIHVIQQRVSYMGEVTLEWSIIEVNHGKLETVQIVSFLLTTHCCVVSLSPKEDKIFIGCIDGSILIADNSNNISEAKKAYFIPSIAAWHPDSSILLISNEKGQIQWFDRALFCIKSQFLSEDSTATTILDLSSYFKHQPTLLAATWSRKSQPSSVSEIDDMILLHFERGPLVVVKLCCGKLTPEMLVSRYLSINCADRAVDFLLTLDWLEESDSALSCLQAIVSYLLRLPLNPEREALLEKAFGSYYKPKQPIPDSVTAEVGDSIHDLTRRFFHHLLRYQISDKAFSLAIDLENYDLFMDLHNYGRITSNPELALAALERAEQVFCSSSDSSGSSCECSESCSCCSSDSSIISQRITPPPLPVLHQQRQKVKFSSDVTHFLLQHQNERSLVPQQPAIDPNMIGLPNVDYLHNVNHHHNLRLSDTTTAPLPDIKALYLSTKTSKNPDEVENAKIKVVHFGLV